MRRIEFDDIESTSLHARCLVECNQAESTPLLIIARTQSGGVGQMRRPWASPRGGLWFTLVHQPLRAMPSLVEGLGLRIGVAVTEALRAAAGAADAHRLRLKWPNDVLIDSRKVCGVLTETAGAGESLRVLVGVGVNLNFDESALPADIRHRTSTLRHALGRDLDRDSVLDELTHRILATVDAPWPDPALITRANSMLHGVGIQQIGVLPDGTADFGDLVGLDPGGLPVVRTSRGFGRLPTTAL